MGEGANEGVQAGGCCHDAGDAGATEAACEGHSHAGGTQVDACGAEEGACCGGQSRGVDDMFAFPTTTEQVTIPAVQLAGLLDLVEKLAADPRLLVDEIDYEQGIRTLAEQAPQLVELRDHFLERMKALLLSH